MQIDFTISKLNCPYCGKCDGTQITDSEYAPGELSNMLPNEVTCDGCGKSYTVNTSLIISIDKVEEPAKHEIPTLFGCNDCGQMTGPPVCERCGSSKIDPVIF